MLAESCQRQHAPRPEPSIAPRPPRAPLGTCRTTGTGKAKMAATHAATGAGAAQAAGRQRGWLPLQRALHGPGCGPHNKPIGSGHRDMKSSGSMVIQVGMHSRMLRAPPSCHSWVGGGACTQPPGRKCAVHGSSSHHPGRSPPSGVPGAGAGCDASPTRSPRKARRSSVRNNGTRGDLHALSDRQVVGRLPRSGSGVACAEGAGSD